MRPSECLYDRLAVCMRARLYLSPNKWKFAMAFGSGLGSMLVDFFTYFLFGFRPCCVWCCLAHSIALQCFDFSPRHCAPLCRAVDVVACRLRSIVLCLLARTVHTYKQFDYNNKCKFTRCFFLYKYDCFINVCHQLESNHRTVEIVKLLLEAAEQHIFVDTYSEHLNPVKFQLSCVFFLNFVLLFYF